MARSAKYVRDDIVRRVATDLARRAEIDTSDFAIAPQTIGGYRGYAIQLIARPIDVTVLDKLSKVIEKDKSMRLYTMSGNILLFRYIDNRPNKAEEIKGDTQYE